MPITNELKDTLTLILAGGKGERLKPLTEGRAKPAVPFAGPYRIIDFTLSNCIHSGMRRIHVLTQYAARSLEEHIRFGWNFLPRRLEQFISVRPPHHKGEGSWYQGTADAIYQNIDTLKSDRPKHVMILSGDHIYKMDYSRMLREHLENKSALTIGAVRIPAAESSRFGIFECDPKGHVLSFEEKPAKGKELPGDPGWCMGSMGIYLFETDELIERLEKDAALGPESSHDFGKDIIPRMIGEVGVYAHGFADEDGSSEPYWRDVGTIEAYYETCLDLCSAQPKLNLYDYNWPIYTLWHNDPPAKTIHGASAEDQAEVTDSLLCPGAILSGGKVHRSILSSRCIVRAGAQVEGSILFNGVDVGEKARIKNSIIDKWVEIPAGEEIGYDLEKDSKRFKVSETGITVIPTGYKF